MSENEEWTFYRDRPDWSDVTPISQDDGPYSVVAIAYCKKFLDVYDYFRGVMKINEKSERAFNLTKDALDLNPSNYSVWQYRRTILKALDKDLKDELAYTEEMIKSSEKNYQVWHHRRVIVEWSQDVSQENALTEFFLSVDPKNYHAWQHRQWYIRTFNVYEGEVEFTERLITEDVRNNSAWNQRYFVLNNTTQFTEDVIQREVDFTLLHIDRVRRNESAWNYLRGIMFHAEKGSPSLEKVTDFCENLHEKGERSPYLLGYIVELCEQAIEQKELKENLTADRAIELCKLLATEVDRIRCNYWQFMERSIAAKAAS